MSLRVQFLVHCFLIYINDLSDNIESNVKHFVDDTSMFLVVCDPFNTSQKLNNDLDKVSLWANKWKISFNPGPSKQAWEVYHPPLLFNNSAVRQISSQKNLGIHLDEELIFKHHINKKKQIKPIMTLELFVNSITFFLVPLY